MIEELRPHSEYWAQSATPMTVWFPARSRLVSELPPEKRRTLADLFVSVRPDLEHLLDKALAIPGVSAIVKSAIDAIRTKLDALAKVQSIRGSAPSGARE